MSFCPESARLSAGRVRRLVRGLMSPRILASMPALMLLLALAFHSQDALAASGGDKGGGGGGGMDTMVPIAPMPITIIHQARIKGILMVEFYLEAPDMAEAGRINQLMPRLMDAYRTGLTEFAVNEVRLDRPVDLNRLELYLNRETRSVIGNKGARVIYRQIMVQRK